MTWAAAITRSTDLNALEAIVEKGKTTFIEVGMALARIRDAKLYKATHSTWENYCQHRWGWSRQRAHQLMLGAEVAMSTAVARGVIPTERHARELVRVSVEDRASVIVEAGARPTAAQVREIVDRRIANASPAAAGQLGFGIPGAPRRDLSQWDTRPDTAAWLVKWAGVKRGMPVLEPSAGKGNLARALLDAGGVVTCVELDPLRAKELEGGGFSTHCDDFLAFAARLGSGGGFARAVMNPPYESGQDLAHILAALSVAPVVVVLARLVLLESQARRAQLWDRHHLRRLCVLSERESFEGDVEGTPKSAFAAFEIARGAGKSIVEWR